MQMVLKGIYIMHQTPKRYSMAIEREDDKLLTRLFYWDMSVAVTAEVSLAESSGVLSSTISHSFDDEGADSFNITDSATFIASTFPRDVIIKATQSLGRATNFSGNLDLRRMLRHNQLLYSYAIALRCLSIADEVQKFDIIV
jgi:hypothetical protein